MAVALNCGLFTTQANADVSAREGVAIFGDVCVSQSGGRAMADAAASMALKQKWEYNPSVGAWALALGNLVSAQPPAVQTVFIDATGWFLDPKHQLNRLLVASPEVGRFPNVDFDSCGLSIAGNKADEFTAEIEHKFGFSGPTNYEQFPGDRFWFPHGNPMMPLSRRSLELGYEAIVLSIQPSDAPLSPSNAEVRALAPFDVPLMKFTPMGGHPKLAVGESQQATVVWFMRHHIPADKWDAAASRVIPLALSSIP